MGILRREFIYIWYYFSVQFEQIFGYWVLGMLIGSMLAAILIMGGLFVLLALIVYGRRKRLILNQTVRMFSRMMSDLGDKYSDDE